MISVIIPTYQHAGTIAACLDSVLGQTLKPFEIIVVNDGSTDGTGAVLAHYADRVTVINQENHGGNAARNRGFETSTGDLVIFCDADVVMRPDMLERLAQALLDRPEVSYAYSAFRFGWKTFSSYDFSAERLKRMNYIHTTTLIRRQAFPGFDPSIKRLQDWDVWLTMLERGLSGTYISEELFRVQSDHGRRGISQWRPSFVYRLPWSLIGWEPSSIRKFKDAKAIVEKKHPRLFE